MKKKKNWRFLPSGKTVLANAVLALAAFLIVALVSAHATTCTLTSVAGPYAVATLGLQAGGYWAGLFVISTDSKGNLSGAGSESINGTISSDVTAAGSYTVTSDCWFTASMTDSLGNLRNLTGSITQNGDRIDGLSTSSGTDWQFTAYRQHSKQCSLASGGGYFVSDVQSPLTPSGSSIATQQWHVDTKGSGTGSWVANYNGTIVQGTANAIFSVNSDCTYTETVTNADGTTGHFFGVEGILEVDDVAWLALETDSGWVSLSTGTALCSYWPHC